MTNEAVIDGVKYSIIKPEYPLNLFVNHFLQAEGIALFSEKVVYPNNFIDLFVNLGSENNGKMLKLNNGFSFKETLISGVRTTPLIISPGNYYNIIGARFNLFGFYLIFKTPAEELVNENICAASVLGNEIYKLREIIGNCNTKPEALQLFQQWLLKKCSNSVFEAKLWQKIEFTIKNNNNNLQAELALKIGFSNKHNIALIKKMTGLPPKKIQRIYKLSNIIRNTGFYTNMQLQNMDSWENYSDQSHFIKNFKEFTGLTPKKFVHRNPADRLL